MDLFKNLYPFQKKTTAKSILSEWDNDKTFPAIPPYNWGYARSKLIVFRSNEEWLSTFQMIGFDSKADRGLNYLYSYGNKIKRKQRFLQEMILEPVKSSPDFPYFEQDTEHNILFDPLDFSIVIRNQEHHFKPTVQEYENLGINLNVPVAGAIDAIVKILRLLTYQMPEKLFLSEQALLTKLGRPAHLPKFVELYEWRHPDYRLREKPSDIPCLVSLARAIASNDKDLIECPLAESNTHWSHWPEWPA